MNGARFVEFIQKLRKDVQRPLIIIADNAPYHRSQPVKDYIAGSQGQVIVENLPRYAPELNPDEQVWNHAKSRLGRLYVTGKKEMKHSVLNIMRSIQRCVLLIQSFFQLPDTSYAA